MSLSRRCGRYSVGGVGVGDVGVVGVGEGCSGGAGREDEEGDKGGDK